MEEPKEWLEDELKEEEKTILVNEHRKNLIDLCAI